MKKQCAHCKSSFSYIKAFVASKAFPVTCNKCREKNYREHKASYFIFCAIFSVGLFLLIFIFLSQGVQLTGLVSFLYVITFFLIYLIECIYVGLERYAIALDRKIYKKSMINALIAILVIILSIVIYYTEN